MLEAVDLNAVLAQRDYERMLPGWQSRLSDLQNQCRRADIPVIILFEAWNTGGKASTISALASALDPRGFTLHSIHAPQATELHYPWLRRYWLKTPAYGEMAIFDRSWYRHVLVERVNKLTPHRAWRRAYRDIVDFEQMLVEDGLVLLKFFLHISRKEQKRRYKLLARNPERAWRFEPDSWGDYRKYDDYIPAVEEMLARTHTEWGKWYVVPSTSRWYAHQQVFETTIKQLELALKLSGNSGSADA